MTRQATRTIPADRTPTISALETGAVILRWATKRTMILTSELPCHPAQIGSARYEPHYPIVADQPIVCRQCGSHYAATPVPPDGRTERHRISYWYVGTVAVSRAKRPNE